MARLGQARQGEVIEWSYDALVRVDMGGRASGLRQGRDLGSHAVGLRFEHY